MNKIVHNLGAPSLLRVIPTIFTNYSRVIHLVMNNPSEMAFVEAWWKYGHTRKREAESYAKRFHDLTGYSPLGIASVTALRLGVSGATWATTLYLMERAVKEGMNLPDPSIKTRPEAS